MYRNIIVCLDKDKSDPLCGDTCAVEMKDENRIHLKKALG
jgi:hypothetical protein